MSSAKYSLLGQLLQFYEPEKAAELLSKHRQSLPLEDNVSNLPVYFDQFCQLLQLDPKEHIGELRSRSKNEARKIFIAVAIHLYCPSLYSHPQFLRIPRTGLLQHLTALFQLNEGNISRDFRSVIAWHQRYDDFREQVLSLVEQMTQNTNEKRRTA